MYDHLGSDRRDLRWLCVRMGNHSVPRADLVALGCLDESLPGANSDQDLGLRLAVAGVEVRLQPRASSILIEHRRGLRAFADASGLARLAERWPRSDVARLHEYFARGYGRSIADYARALSAGVPQPPPATSIQSPVSSSRTEVSR
jgi:hypothetical protein